MKPSYFLPVSCFGSGCIYGIIFYGHHCYRWLFLTVPQSNLPLALAELQVASLNLPGRALIWLGMLPPEILG